MRAVIRKPEKERTAAEQKIADDYFPVLRIDSGKIMEIMPAAERKKYQAISKQLEQAGRRRGGAVLPAFWTVEVDPHKALEKSYILTSGDPDRPEKNHEVQPGWPFAPAKIDFRDGRVEAFSDWLTAPENPLFARVAVNRLWQWHFGEGLQKMPSDFGKLGGTPANPRAARLAGRRVREAPFQHEGDAPADRHLGHLQAGVGGRARSGHGQRQGRSGQRVSVAFPAAAAGGRADLGFDSVARPATSI